MCLGIPGQVVEMLDDTFSIAKVEVSGVKRNVNVALVVSEGIAPGDWMVIHVGFAMSKIDEQIVSQHLAPDGPGAHQGRLPKACVKGCCLHSLEGASLEALQPHPHGWCSIVRSIEILYACDEALRMIDAYETPARPAAEMQPRAATGYACTEAPRGILYHRYRLDETGQILDAQTSPISPGFFALSTQAFGVAQAIELARVLSNFPSRLVVYGIEARRFVAGMTLSPEVERAAHATVEGIARLVESWRQP